MNYFLLSLELLIVCSVLYIVPVMFAGDFVKGCALVFNHSGYAFIILNVLIALIAFLNFVDDRVETSNSKLSTWAKPSCMPMEAITRKEGFCLTE